MKKKILAISLLLAGAMTANAQGYTTLGIGVNPPEATLHVHSDSVVTPGSNLSMGGDGPRSGGGSAFQDDYSTTFKMTNGNTSNGGFMISQDNLDVMVSQLEQGSLSFHTPGGHVTLEADGRVGIGASNSNYGFNVAKTSRFSQAVLMTQTLGVGGVLTASGGLAVSGQFNVGSALTVSDNNVGCHALTVSNNLTVAKSIFLNKNLTMGGTLQVQGHQTVDSTLTVGMELTVGDGFTCDATGHMKVKHLRVTTSDWPDYVFGEGYRLIPLGEVEEYIGHNGHLPEVPAAAEMEADGVDQGELNKVLMQKVEELTLYIIDLQKQIEELKKK